MTAPRTEAGRSLLTDADVPEMEPPVQLIGYDFEGLRKAILAIEAEAAALTPGALDVERLAHAMGVFAFPPVSWPPDPSFLEEIAAEYARLSAGQAEDEGL